MPFATARAQDFPSKPIKIVVPFAAGSATDTTARGLGAKLHEILKQPVPVTKQDPYPIGQRLFMHDERLTGLIVNNLHERLLEKRQGAPR